MKIEKINKENIKEFIRDMKLEDANNLELNINKSELYGVKKNDSFCLGFNSLTLVDTIAILHYNSKMSNELFYECIDFLDRSLVVQNHLIIEVYNEKYIKLLDDKYKCKEMIVTLILNKENSQIEGNDENKKLKEKFIDIEMKSIKYNASKDIVSCNLIKQNIQDEQLILDLHNHFIDLGVNTITFTINSDNYDYFNTLGYECLSKNYIIRN